MVGTAKGSELIAFSIGSQEFCISTTSVREIRGWTPATALPHAPPFVLGVVNLRGLVLPIVDLAVRLGFPQSEPKVRHAIIVVEYGAQVAGLLVDGVSDIFTASEEQIRIPSGAPRLSNFPGRRFTEPHSGGVPAACGAIPCRRQCGRDWRRQCGKGSPQRRRSPAEAANLC